MLLLLRDFKGGLQPRFFCFSTNAVSCGLDTRAANATKVCRGETMCDLHAEPMQIQLVTKQRPPGVSWLQRWIATSAEQLRQQEELFQWFGSPIKGKGNRWGAKGASGRIWCVRARGVDSLGPPRSTLPLGNDFQGVGRETPGGLFCVHLFSVCKFHEPWKTLRYHLVTWCDSEDSEGALQSPRVAVSGLGL